MATNLVDVMPHLPPLDGVDASDTIDTVFESNRNLFNSPKIYNERMDRDSYYAM